MKNLLLIVFMVAGMITGKLVAQTHEPGSKEKMNVFAGWTGHWQGEGSMQMGPGEPRKSKVDERIEYKLDGMILMVEGTGTDIDPATKKEMVVHHALAILSYDHQSSVYKFKSYLKDGRSTDAWLNILGENKYQWGFETPQGSIRYNIIVDPGKKIWNETGEYSKDGTNWMKFFEMNLKKVD